MKNRNVLPYELFYKMSKPDVPAHESISLMCGVFDLIGNISYVKTAITGPRKRDFPCFHYDMYIYPSCLVGK